MLTASEFFSRAQRRLTFDVPAGLADPHVIPRHDDHADPAVVIAILVALKLLRREGDGPDGTYCNTPEGAGIWLGWFRAKEQPDLGEIGLFEPSQLEGDAPGASAAVTTMNTLEKEKRFLFSCDNLDSRSA